MTERDRAFAFNPFAQSISQTCLVGFAHGEMFALCAQVGKDARAPNGYSGFGSLSRSFVVLSVTLGGARISPVCGRRHGAVLLTEGGGNAETRAAGIGGGAKLVCVGN